MHFNLTAFFIFGKESKMRVRYKHNKKAAYYNSDILTTYPKAEAPARPRGPFASCGDCPYAHHGFICYSKEGDCMKTDLQRMAERKKLATSQRETEVYAQ